MRSCNRASPLPLIRRDRLPSSPPFLDVVGLLALSAFIFAVPAIYLNTAFSGQRLFQALAILAFVANIHKFNPARLNLAMLALAALCGYFSATALSPQDPDVQDTFTVWSKFTIFSILLSLVICRRAQLMAVLGALAASAILVAYSSHDALVNTQETLSQVTTPVESKELARTSGVFANANILGMYAVDAIVASVTLFFTSRTWISLLLCSVSSASAAYLALFCGSRKAILGICCVVVFVIGMTIRTRKSGRVLTYIAPVLFAIAGLVWVLTNPYLTRFNTNEESFQVRSELIDEAWSCIKTSPVLGLGYRGFEHTSSSGLYTHSTPLEILCNGGIFAFGLYILLWWGLCKSLFSCLALETNQKEIALLYGIGCYLLVQVIGSLTSVVIEEPRYLVMLACSSGYLHSRELELRHARINNKSSGIAWLHEEDGQ